MKREALILALLLCQPAFAQNSVEDIGVKTGGYSTEEPQLKPAIPEEKKDLVVTDKTLEALQPVPNIPAEAPKKKRGVKAKVENFFAGFHPDNVEKRHPKLNKSWNGYMFVYDHGLKQTLDIAAKVGQIKFGFF